MRFDRAKHLSQRLAELNRGYQALTVRCARISDELKLHRPYVRAIIGRSRTVIAELNTELANHAGREVTWTRAKLQRTGEAIDEFETRCLDQLPPTETGWMSTLGRIFTP
jgi:predicted RNase H-like nuclease (RuvC/YqgF family)